MPWGVSPSTQAITYSLTYLLTYAMGVIPLHSSHDSRHSRRSEHSYGRLNDVVGVYGCTGKAAALESRVWHYDSASGTVVVPGGGNPPIPGHPDGCLAATGSGKGIMLMACNASDPNQKWILP